MYVCIMTAGWTLPVVCCAGNKFSHAEYEKFAIGVAASGEAVRQGGSVAGLATLCCLRVKGGTALHVALLSVQSFIWNLCGILSSLHDKVYLILARWQEWRMALPGLHSLLSEEPRRTLSSSTERRVCWLCYALMGRNLIRTILH